MRRRLRKKLHQKYLDTVCVDAVTNGELRQRLLEGEPFTPFRVEGGDPRVQRLVRGRSLRYWAAVAQKLAPSTAVVIYWADEFPTVWNEAVIFSFADLGIDGKVPGKQ